MREGAKRMASRGRAFQTERMADANAGTRESRDCCFPLLLTSLGMASLKKNRSDESDVLSDVTLIN